MGWALRSPPPLAQSFDRSRSNPGDARAPVDGAVFLGKRDCRSPFRATSCAVGRHPPVGWFARFGLCPPKLLRSRAVLSRGSIRHPRPRECSLTGSTSERVVVVCHLANDMLGDRQGGCRRRRWRVAHQGDTRLVINDEVINEAPIAPNGLRAYARPRANEVNPSQVRDVGVGTTEEE
jgi:hypothetical protein